MLVVWCLGEVWSVFGGGGGWGSLQYLRSLGKGMPCAA